MPESGSMRFLSKASQWKIILISLVAVIAIGVGGFFLIKVKEENTPPPVLEANFVDISYIQKISKFRSCQGHTVVPQDESEMRRNMKHYYWLRDEYQNKDVPIYAPFDGKITTVMSDPDHGLEGEIWMGNGSQWQFSVQHIYPAEDIKEGKKVKMGQLLGNINTDDSFDIVYAAGGLSFPTSVDGWNSPYGALDSVFSHMSDEAFAPYAQKGLKKEDLIISKEARDADPCTYDTNPESQVAQLMNYTQIEDWVTINHF